MRFAKLALLGSLALWCGNELPARADTLLQMKFVPGETVRHEMVQKMSQEITVPGRPQIASKMTQIMNMEMAVDEVGTDGTAQVRQRIVRSRMTMQTPAPLNQTIEIDTDKAPPADPTGQMLAKTMKGVTAGEFRLKIKKTGEVTDIVVPKELIETAKQNPALAQLGEMFSEEGLKQMTKIGQVVFPSNALKSGDSWQESQELSTPLGTMKTTRTMTYLGTTDGHEKIGVETTVGLTPKENNPVKVTFKPNKGQGELLFDNTRGRVVKSSVTAVIESEIQAGAQTIFQKVTTETDLKLQDTPAAGSNKSNTGDSKP